MRIWPAAPGFFRAAKRDTTVGEYAFAEGEWAFVLLLAVQRDKKAWGEDADQFNPDRFSPENARGRAPELFKPFGTGIRSCIGRQFALHEMALAIATVLTQFSVTAEPGYELEVEETLTLRPKKPEVEFYASLTAVAGAAVMVLTCAISSSKSARVRSALRAAK